MFKSERLPEALEQWLKEAFDNACSIVSYGSALKQLWADPRQKELIDELCRDLCELDQQYTLPFRESCAGGFKIPGYHGILNRSLQLVQMADRLQRGKCLENIAVSTVPSNSRWAAVYRPHRQKDWSVIGMDWGFITGLWGLSVIFADNVTLSNIDDGIEFSMDARRLHESVMHNREKATASLLQFLIPCIVMGDSPPMPLPLNFDSQSKIAVQGLLFDAMMFVVVAHEYGHLVREHQYNHRDTAERVKMEHEADGMVLVSALSNPWAKLSENEMDQFSAPLATIAQILVFSLIQMLECADIMLSNLGKVPLCESSHPPAQARQEATDYLLSDIIKLSAPTRDYILRSRYGMGIFADTLWNVSVHEVLEQMKKLSISTNGRSAEVFTFSADLRFH